MKMDESAEEHVRKAEGYLMLVESAFPNLTSESQERLRLAEIHCSLANVYQLGARDGMEGVTIGSLDISEFRQKPKKVRLTWKFWNWFE